MSALHWPIPFTAVSSAEASSSLSRSETLELEFAAQHVLGERAQEADLRA